MGVRALIDRALDDDAWLAVFQRMAGSDNPKLLELLLRYRWGGPDAPSEQDAETQPLVRINLPDNAPRLERTPRPADSLP